MRSLCVPCAFPLLICIRVESMTSPIVITLEKSAFLHIDYKPATRQTTYLISYLVLKIGYINKKHTQSRAEKSYFNLAYVFLFSAKNRIYIIKHPQIHKMRLKFGLTISKPFSPFYLEEMNKLLKSCHFHAPLVSL